MSNMTRPRGVSGGFQLTGLGACAFLFSLTAGATLAAAVAATAAAGVACWWWWWRIGAVASTLSSACACPDTLAHASARAPSPPSHPADNFHPASVRA
jgi:hypothetical protein